MIVSAAFVKIPIKARGLTFITVTIGKGTSTGGDWSHGANEAALSYYLCWGRGIQKLRVTLKQQLNSSNLECHGLAYWDKNMCESRVTELTVRLLRCQTLLCIFSCTNVASFIAPHEDYWVKSRWSVSLKVTLKSFRLLCVRYVSRVQSHTHTVTKIQVHGVNLVQLVPLMCWCALINKLTLFGHLIPIVSIVYTILLL